MDIPCPIQKILPCNDSIEHAKSKYFSDIASHYQPYLELGGDFWGMHFISDSKCAIYNVDFVGHGIPAAINCLKLHKILQNDALFTLDTDKFLYEINNKLYEILPRGQFATFFYAIIDIENKVINYSVAASPGPIKVSKNDISILSGEGSPLGAYKDSIYTNLKADFNEGDLLFFYSDALIETENPEGIFLKEEDIASYLHELYDSNCSEIISLITNKLSIWSQNTRLLSKLASGREFEGGSEHRTGMYKEVHEDSSTESTDKLPAEVELRKKSTPLQDDLTLVALRLKNS